MDLTEQDLTTGLNEQQSQEIKKKKKNYLTRAAKYYS